MRPDASPSRLAGSLFSKPSSASPQSSSTFRENICLPPLRRLKAPVAYLGSGLACLCLVITHAAAEVQNPVVRRGAVSLPLPVPGWGRASLTPILS